MFFTNNENSATAFANTTFKTQEDLLYFDLETFPIFAVFPLVHVIGMATKTVVSKDQFVLLNLGNP